MSLAAWCFIDFLKNTFASYFNRQLSVHKEQLRLYFYLIVDQKWFVMRVKILFNRWAPFTVFTNHLANSLYKFHFKKLKAEKFFKSVALKLRYKSSYGDYSNATLRSRILIYSFPEN